MGSKDLMDLKSIWDKKLRDSGFKDIEDSKGRLKYHDTRTKAFNDRDALLHFFLSLDSYLSHQPKLPPQHRLVLELYSSGMHLNDIAPQVNCGLTKIKEIIKYYTTIILAS
jgi:hypothetical protein